MASSHHFSIKMLMAFVLNLLLLSLMAKAEEASTSEKNQPQKASVDEDAAATAEFRQGSGISQQLMSVPVSAIYGGNGYQQFMANGGAAAAATAAAGAGASYGNMLRQLYRPQSLGLTDKVRNWVKSFLNRRQYVKPYYNPGALLSYGSGATGLEEKPVYINGVSYKPVSVPLRQIQKYFKPFYGGAAAQSAADSAAAQSAMAQYLATAAASSPPRSPSFGSESGLYASESAGTALFSSGIPGVGIFNNPGGSGSAVFGSGSHLAGLGTSSSSGQLGSQLSFSPNSGLFTSSGGMYNTGGGGYGSSGISSSSGNLYGYGSSGSLEDLASSSSSFYPSSGSSAASSGSNSGISGIYGGGGGGGRNADSASPYSVGGSQQDPSSNYASYSVGASQSDPASNYASYSVGGPSESAYASYESGSYPVESAYSMSYQKAPQSSVASGKSYLSGSSFQEKASQFQPVSFGASDGGSHFKAVSGSSNGNSGHHAGPSLSSSSSALYVSEKGS